MNHAPIDQKLFAAASSGDVAGIQSALAAGANPNATFGDDQCTP